MEPEYDGVKYVCDGLYLHGDVVIANLRSFEVGQTTVLLGGIAEVCEELSRVSSQGQGLESGDIPSQIVSVEEALRACCSRQSMRALAKQLISSAMSSLALREAQAQVSNLIRERATAVSGKFIGTAQERLQLSQTLQRAMFSAVDALVSRVRSGSSGVRNGIVDGELTISDAAKDHGEPVPTHNRAESVASMPAADGGSTGTCACKRGDSKAEASICPNSTTPNQTAGSILDSRMPHNFLGLPSVEVRIRPGFRLTVSGSYAILRASLHGSMYFLLVGREKVYSFPV